MLPNSQNNSAQVKQMLYSKKIKRAKNAVADDDVPDSPDSETSAAADKKLRDIEEIFTRHSSTTEVTFDGSILTPSKLNNIKSSDDKSYVYPFISRKIFTAPNLTKPKPKSKSKVNVCIFRVFNTRQGDPFLQFKLQKSNDSTTSLSFPIATVPGNETTESAWKNAADESVRRWFPETTDSIKWKGLRADPITDEIYAMYEEDYYDDAVDTIEKNPISVKSEWWWACVHEIMNRNKLLSFDIHSTVIDLFEHVPAIMFLYDRQTGYIIEIPHVLYSGITEGSTLDELVDLGPIKIIDNTVLKGDDDASGASGATDVNGRSIYGTQHYLYEYESVFRSACYNRLKNAKRSDPHLFRHAVFLGNTMINMFDADNTTTATSVADIRNYANTTWASNGYNSVHHGRYKLPNANANKNKKRGSGSGIGSESGLYLDPVFCVSNNERIVTLGHYKINVKSVPSKFNDGHEDAIDKYELL